MKIKIDLTAADLRELNDPETEPEVIAKAHNMLTEIFDNRENLIKCSISIDDKE